MLVTIFLFVSNLTKLLILYHVVSTLKKEINELKSDLTTIENKLSPLSETVESNGLQFNVRSIPKLLSAIDTEDGTLFEYVTANSNSNTESLNLMKVHNHILNSLQSIKLN